MHGLMSYRRFGRARLLRSDRAWLARSLRSDRAWLELGRYVATERNTRSVAWRPFSSYCPMSRVFSAKLFVRKNLFRKSICRRKFSFSSSDVFNVNFVVTVFDPNS
ncbi:hypothetical protein DY000_02039001 [Brassica cretica]|uniref:Uncharacterized protein n=1 Tax=Brassica cretica TaxID=69181 RepID=A0ABQ7BIW8_BRACR|nr:hypothetical protein DY000_02039001 [Brassica cretica]